MNNYNVYMSTGVEVENKIYLSSININGLFEYDINENSLCYISPFIKENPCYSMHRRAFNYSGEIWFVPQHGKRIAVFDKDSGKIDYLMPKYSKEFVSPLDKLPTISYACGLFDRDFLFILPAGIDSANVINMKTKEIISFENIIEEGEYISAGVFHDGYIHAFTGDGKWRIAIDTTNKTVKRYEWRKRLVVDIVWDENNRRFLIPVYGERVIIIADEQFKSVKEFEYRMPADNDAVFGRIMYSNNKIIWFPISGGYCGEMKTHQITNLTVDSVKRIYEGNNEYIPIESNNYYIGTVQDSPFLILQDKSMTSVKTVGLRMDLLEINRIIKAYGIKMDELFWRNELLFVREGKIDISTFIDYCKCM